MTQDETEWTLEGELQRLAGLSSTAAALAAIGVLPTIQDSFSLTGDTSGWVRGGAETYIYRFRVRTDREELRLLLKACVAFSPTNKLDDILAAWIDRRRLLAGSGIRTPKLYAHGFGVLLEEEVPHDLNAILESGKPVPETILLGLAELAGVVTAHGFQPIGLFTDLRSHGDDVVMVDFGQDLGPPGAAKEESTTIFDELMTYLGKQPVQVRDELRTRLWSIYEAQRHLGHH